MRDASIFLAVFAVMFLAIAVLAWGRIIRKPDKQPPTAKNNKRSESAAMVIVIAFLLSAAGAAIAIAGWIQR